MNTLKRWWYNHNRLVWEEKLRGCIDFNNYRSQQYQQEDTIFPYLSVHTLPDEIRHLKIFKDTHSFNSICWGVQEEGIYLKYGVSKELSKRAHDSEKKALRDYSNLRMRIQHSQEEAKRQEYVDIAKRALLEIQDDIGQLKECGDNLKKEKDLCSDCKCNNKNK